jgi:hypothetical protein
MSKHFGRILFTAGLAALASVASPITYHVSVNTSAINGTMGFLDFDLAPGNNSQSASVTIGNFSGTGSLSGAPQVNGAVSGTLPGSLLIGNSTQFNDYFQGFTFGASIMFQLAFSGPALSSPNGTSTSGSTFAFGMFDATGNNPLLTTDPNGNTFIVAVNLDGTTCVTTFPPATGGIPVATVAAGTSTAPEPSTLLLTVLALTGTLILKSWQHSRKLK